MSINLLKDLPLVSIGIPSYNRPEMLRRAISSTLAQTYPKIEVVVSDDASTNPDTIKVIEEFSVDARIRHTFHKRNVGLVRNFQQCFEMARGDFWLCLPNDDWLEPDAIKLMIAYFTTPEVGLVICAQHIHSVKGNRIIKTPGNGIVDGKIFVKDRLAGKCGFPPTELYRTSVVKACGGYKDIGYAMDLFLELKTGQCSDIAYLNKPLVNHGNHPLTASNDEQLYVMHSIVNFLDYAEPHFDDIEVNHLLHRYCIRSLVGRTLAGAFVGNREVTALGLQLLKRIQAPPKFVFQARLYDLRFVQIFFCIARSVKRFIFKKVVGHE
jgi:glycosyltransferase involved in cell wall biosynthesis